MALRAQQKCKEKPTTRFGSADLACRHSLARTQQKRSIELIWHMIRLLSLVCGVPALLNTYVCTLYYSFPSFKIYSPPSLPYLSTFTCRFSRNHGDSNSWKSRGLSRTVQGLLYHSYFRSYAHSLAFFLILVRISLNSLPWPTPSLYTRSP